MEEKKIDRRVRKTKRQLRLALTELLQEKPIKDITVREIADRVDINRGTFYLHYRDVYDMLEKIEKELFAEFNEIMQSHKEETDPTKPLPILNDIFQFFIDNADMAIALLGPNGDHAFVNQLQDIVKEHCVHNLMLVYRHNNPKHFEYFYAFIVNGCIGLFQTWLETGMKESPEEMSSLAEQFILRGIQVLA